ncbi:MAG TPA: GTP-binding protein, partial [Firmicutes bacterium]|nr:GTP-binding protein [Bacillota bacterium]
MSRAAKIYIAIICFALMFVLGTGVSGVKSKSHRGDGQFKWLASMSAAFDTRLRETLGQTHENNGNSESAHSANNADLPPVLEPSVVKGVYVTSWIAGTKAFDQVVDFIHKTEVNSMVIDVKDDTGMVSYASKVPLVKSIGSSYKKYDPQKIMTVLKQNQIYPIARIVVFKDPYLAKHRPDLAVKNLTGDLWHDYRGLSWVDPYNKEVWDYNISIAKEAVDYGFREIQFDYVRFTSDGNIRDCRYPEADGRVKSDVIRDFLKYAYQELKPMGVKVSADVFGLTCSAKDDMGIGQVMGKVAEGVDVICPMVYPSHYYRGEYQIADPDSEPYETVFRSLTDAKQKIANVPHKVVIRAWLQDFSLRNHYGREQLQAQIRAVENAGFKEWIFWNPSSR